MVGCLILFANVAIVAEPKPSPERERAPAIRVSSLFDSPIAKDLRVTDVVIDIDYARVPAVTVGRSDDPSAIRAVPFACLRYNPQSQQFTIGDTTPKVPADPKKLLDPATIQAGMVECGQRPYWLGDGWSSDGPYGRLLDPKRVEHFSGKLERVRKLSPFHDMAPGVAWVVRVGDESRRVDLGPAWFLESRNPRPKIGATVEVDAAPAKLGNTAIWIATKVAAEGKSWELRQPTGKVAWGDGRPLEGPPRFRSARALLGKPVRGPDGAEKGRITDAAFRPRSGQIIYLAFESGSTLRAIPLGAFELAPSSDALVLRVDDEVLVKTPSFNAKAEWPRNVDRIWKEYVGVRYGNPGLHKKPRSSSP